MRKELNLMSDQEKMDGGSLRGEFNKKIAQNVAEATKIVMGGLALATGVAMITTHDAKTASIVDLIAYDRSRSKNMLQLNANDPLISGDDGGNGGDDPKKNKLSTNDDKYTIPARDGNINHDSFIPVDPETTSSEGRDWSASTYYANGAGQFVVLPGVNQENGSFGIGNRVSDKRSQDFEGSSHPLLDLSGQFNARKPHLDENGNTDGTVILLGALEKRVLEFLVANSGVKNPGARYERQAIIDELYESGKLLVPVEVTIINGVSVDGSPEISMTIAAGEVADADGKISTTPILTTELHQGKVVLPTGKGGAKNANFIHATENGVPVLIMMPTFPEGTDSKFVSWQDENGQWWGGEKSGDKQLTLNNGGEWESLIKLTPEQKIAIDTLNVELGGAWSIDASGKVTDASGNIPEGVTYDIEKGTLMRTYSYEYDGRMQNEITVALTINNETPMPEGCSVNFEAWCITQEGKLARKTYSTDRDKKANFGIAGYGYEGDGNPAHERNFPLYTIAEQHNNLKNTDNVDMSVEGFGATLNGNNKHFRKYRGISSFVYGGTPDNPVIFEPGNDYVWGDNRIFEPDGKGGYTEITTTYFLVGELNTNLISIIHYIGSDGELKVMFGDTSEIMIDENAPGIGNSDWRPLKWSEYYKDHSTKY